MIADYSAKRVEEVFAILEMDEVTDKSILFKDALAKFLHIVLDDTEGRSWIPFIARCAYDNDEAFALIYDQAIAPFLECLIRAAGDFAQLDRSAEKTVAANKCHCHSNHQLPVFTRHHVARDGVESNSK